ncbi:MAG: DNA cytosine methyltransferase [Caulobacterales bacterium]
MHRDSGAALYEFFAGGGFARLGLEPSFRCVLANDFSPAKARAYRAAFGGDHLSEADVWSLTPADLPGTAALAWASFPCQDVSLAGGRAGLDGARSGAIWGFLNIISALDAEGRAPETLALENVTGLLTSNGGADFAALIEALAARCYKVGALEIDAALFVPQSRPRLFVIATRSKPDSDLVSAAPSAPFHSPGLIAAAERLPLHVRAAWQWWRLPTPPARNTALIDLLDKNAPLDDEEKTRRLLAMMTPLQRARVLEMQRASKNDDGRKYAGALFRRIRIEDGVRVQRAEARFDGVAGCLRTPAGGSSRQTVLIIQDGKVRSRLISPREAARLMGVPDEYPLPARTNEALHLFGDGVCVSVVRWLSDHLLAPLAGVRLSEAA